MHVFILGVLAEPIAKMIPLSPAKEDEEPTPQTKSTENLFGTPSVDRRFITSRANQRKTSIDKSQVIRGSTTIASLNIDKLRPEDMENVDISNLVNVDISSTMVAKLPLDLAGDMDISMEDLEEADLKDVCAICMQDKASEKHQLVECTRCNKKFHTRCLRLPQIPYTDYVPVERRKREAYVGVIDFFHW